MTTTFEVIGATFLLRHALPTLAFALRVTEPAGPLARAICTIALRVEILIEPAHRARDARARAGLAELFDEGERWAAVPRLPWRQVDTLVPSFSGSTTFLVPVTCDFHREVAATRYFHRLGDGEVALMFRFSGTVFHEARDGRLQIEKLDRDAHAAFRLSTRTWGELMSRYDPGGSWIRLSPETFERLRAQRDVSGAISYDSAISKLLERQGHGSLRVRR